MQHNNSKYRIQNRLKNSNLTFTVFKFLPGVNKYKYVGKYTSYLQAAKHINDLKLDNFLTKLIIK